MENALTNDTKAIILLCGVLSNNSSTTPLNQREYNQLVQWLMHQGLHPRDLFDSSHTEAAAQGSGLASRRLKDLLGRGVQFALAVEQWQQNGLWIISRSDAVYPKRLKQHLKEQAPPLLFGAGDQALLEGGGLAIIGSRNVDEEGIRFTKQAAALYASNGLPIVSGGARGVDQIARKDGIKRPLRLHVISTGRHRPNHG
jgi:predicted Rossmann fold nucleotide-binding protein DprA/Smf involved in DNA uptake